MTFSDNMDLQNFVAIACCMLNVASYETSQTNVEEVWHANEQSRFLYGANCTRSRYSTSTQTALPVVCRNCTLYMVYYMCKYSIPVFCLFVMLSSCFIVHSTSTGSTWYSTLEIRNPEYKYYRYVLVPSYPQMKCQFCASSSQVLRRYQHHSNLHQYSSSALPSSAE